MPAALKGKRRLMGEINVVPYIDVMLVLLIIFMVTAPLLTQGVQVELPKAPADAVNASREPLIVSINRSGQLFLNIGAQPMQPLEPEVLQARATAALRREPSRTVLVKGDTAVAYGRVIEAMVLLQQAGARKVGFLTESGNANRRSAP